MMRTVLLLIFIFSFGGIFQQSEGRCFSKPNCDLKLNNKCYVHVNQSVNWNEAEYCCAAWGGHLASIHSVTENNILNHIRNKDRFTWIGLSDSASDGTYVWTDETEFDYKNFARNQPDSLGGESCFHFFDQARGEAWNDYHCTRSSWGNVKTSYICQKNFASESGECFSKPTCDLSIERDCYVHIDQAVNWNEAESCCVAWGGHLASIHSDVENDLVNYIRSKDRFTWIGLSDSASDGTYVWTDGTELDYRNFAKNQPDSLGGESCFHFFDQARGEDWNDYHCSRSTWGQVQTSYICKRKMCPLLEESRCDMSLNGKCYIFVDMKSAWSDAERCCVEWGGHLTSIHSDLENYAVSSLRDGRDLTWIGLNDIDNEGTFVWTDGTANDYTQFSRNQPDNARGTEHCVHLWHNGEQRDQLTWNDLPCDRQSRNDHQTSYVCKKDYKCCG